MSLNGNVGNNFSLNAITIASGKTLDAVLNKTVDLNNSLSATAITLNSSATLKAASFVTGAVSLANNSNLDLRDGAYFSGTINGNASGVGQISTSGLVIVLGPVGASNAISQVDIASGSQGRFANSDSSHANTIAANDINVSGRLDLMDATTISGNVTMIGSSSSINSSGYSHTINGDFASSAGSQIIVGVHTANTADKFTVAGAAIIDASTKLYVSFANGGTTALGSSYVIIEGGAGSNINKISDDNILIDGVATNKYGNYRLSTSVSGNNLLLNVLSASSPTTSANQNKIYDVIMGVTAGSSGALYQLQQYLGGNASDNDKVAILNSALPQIDNATNRVSFNVASESLNVSSNRIAEVFAKKENPNLYFAVNQNKNSGRDYKVFGGEEKLFSFWSQIFGSNINQGNTAASSGYNANVRGVTFGIDKKIESDLVAGISGSYAYSNAKSNDALKQTDINSYQINLYTGHQLKNYFMNNLVGFVWNDYKSNRNILVAGANASANYSGQNYIARSEIGFNKKLPENFIISPSLMITAARNVVEDYNETGSSNVNLSVKNKSANFFEVRAGAVLSNNYQVKKFYISPSLFANYGYDLAGAKQKTSANFVGSSTTFDSTSQGLAQGSFKTGLSTKIYKVEEISFDLNYTYEKRISYHANSFALKASYKF